MEDSGQSSGMQELQFVSPGYQKEWRKIMAAEFPILMKILNPQIQEKLNEP